MSVSIYALIDPRNGSRRYVGKTTGPLRTRLRAHINDVKRGRTYIPRHRWIADLLTAGKAPEIELLEIVDEAEWQTAEQRWIVTMRERGCDLLNATAGGDGLASYVHRADTRVKQSVAAKKRYLDTAERERTGAAVATAHARPEVKEQKRCIAAGFSVDHKARFRDGGNRYARSAEGRAASSQRFKGRVFSEETRLKLSLSRTGQKRSLASVEATAAKLRGRKLTPEHKANISAGRLRKQVPA